MKVTFPLPTDGKMHRYCISCNKEGASRISTPSRTYYHCPTCGKDNDRTIYFDKHKVWLDNKRELWHESAGVYVRRKDGKFLFFLRTEFPMKLTVPAGHVDRGEQPEVAATRELLEETGISGTPKFIGNTKVVGDSCSSGADSHDWNLYLLELNTDGSEVQILEEGEKPLWLTLDEAKNQGMAYVIEQVTDQFRAQLES